MIRIDDTLLEEIGLIALPKQDRDQLLRQIYETLEMRVGMRLAERMTDQQLDEFERFIDTNDESGALKWLETNFPDYKQVVADELEKLKAEIKKDSSKIVEAMQAQGAQPPQAVQPQQFGQPASLNSPPQAPGQQFAQPQQPPQLGAQNSMPDPQPMPSPQPAPQQTPVQSQPFQPMPTSQPAAQNDFGQQQPSSLQDDPSRQDDTTPSQQSGSIPPPPSA